MQDIFGCNGLSANAAFGKRNIFWDGFVQMMANHQHIKMFFKVLTVYGRVGLVEEGIHVFTATLIMSGACPPLPLLYETRGLCALSSAPVFQQTRLVKRVCVDHHLYIHCVCHRQTAVNRGRRSPPILMQFQSAQAPALTFALQAHRQSCITFACKALRFIGKAISRLQHSTICQGTGVQVVARVPCAGPYRRPALCVDPECRASSICWANKMNMAVKTASG